LSYQMSSVPETTLQSYRPRLMQTDRTGA
ncbi:uncharacterized protein METZ01_LOCUS439304, partial [marine metagenome]